MSNEEDRIGKLAQIALGEAYKPAAVSSETIEDLISAFEDAAQCDDAGNEFWFARDLQQLLGYAKWDNFLTVVQRARDACEASFQTHGYKGLYGGLDVPGIRRHKGLKSGQQILDHMGSTELAANLFRATQTEEKLRKEKTKGKDAANRTHYEVGAKVRQTIREIGGDMPEALSPAEDIRKVERRLKRGIGAQKGIPGK